MASQSSQAQTGKPSQQTGAPRPNEGGTFKTDVSETDEEGTTVREAEVREDDLSEVDSSKGTGQK